MTIPEGWPTEEMCRGLIDFCNVHLDLSPNTWEARQMISAALSAAPTPPAQENQWQEAVLNECMTIEGCYTEADPVGTVKCLIDWHVRNTANWTKGATPPAQEDEPRLVSYGLNLETCTLNFRGEEYYFERTSSTAQEDEPVAYHDTFTNRLRWPVQICTNSEGRMKGLHYTRPDNDGMRKAADEVWDLFDSGHTNNELMRSAMDNLRAELAKR